MPKKKKKPANAAVIKAARELKKRGGRPSLTHDLVAPSGVAGATRGGLTSKSRSAKREAIAKQTRAKRVKAQEAALKREEAAARLNRKDKLQATRKKPKKVLHDFAKGKDRVPRPSPKLAIARKKPKGRLVEVPFDDAAFARDMKRKKKKK